MPDVTKPVEYQSSDVQKPEGPSSGPQPRILTAADFLGTYGTPDYDPGAITDTGGFTIDADGWIEWDVKGAVVGAKAHPGLGAASRVQLYDSDGTALGAGDYWDDYVTEFFVEVDAVLDQNLVVFGGFGNNVDPSAMTCSNFTGAYGNASAQNVAHHMRSRTVWSTASDTAAPSNTLRVFDLWTGLSDNTDPVGASQRGACSGLGVNGRASMGGTVIARAGHLAEISGIPLDFTAAHVGVGQLASLAGATTARFRIQYLIHAQATRGSRGWRA